MNPLPWLNPSRVHALQQALLERILVIDGAMGTMIQRHELGEADYRGQRFADGMLWVAGAQLDGMTCMQLFANRLRSRRQILRAHRASGFDSIVSMRRKR